MESNGYKHFRKKELGEYRPYTPGESVEGVSISAADLKQGCPKAGDYIGRNPKNHEDRWLVEATFFAANFERVE